VDLALVERARKGDRDAFGALASEISDRLYSVAARIVRDPDAAGDALQSALVQIWRDLPSLRDPARFEAWAHRVVVNRCRAQLRADRRRPQILVVSPRDAIVTDSEGALGAKDELERAFRRLTPDQRAVVVLVYFRDLTLPQVASWLGISIGTVKSRLHYARLALRASLEADARTSTVEGRTA
jgi:RNA polymerase sigma-70 factor (ECF subfamily)